MFQICPLIMMVLFYFYIFINKHYVLVLRWPCWVDGALNPRSNCYCIICYVKHIYIYVYFRLYVSEEPVSQTKKRQVSRKDGTGSLQIASRHRNAKRLSENGRRSGDISWTQNAKKMQIFFGGLKAACGSVNMYKLYKRYRFPVWDPEGAVMSGRSLPRIRSNTKRVASWCVFDLKKII